jgi:hypothetical protein
MSLLVITACLAHPISPAYAEERETLAAAPYYGLDIDTDNENSSAVNTRLRNIDLTKYELFTGSDDDKYRAYEKSKDVELGKLKASLFGGTHEVGTYELAPYDKLVSGLTFSDLRVTAEVGMQEEQRNLTPLIVIAGAFMCAVTVIVTRAYYRRRRKEFE